MKTTKLIIFTILKLLIIPMFYLAFFVYMIFGMSIMPTNLAITLGITLTIVLVVLYLAWLITHKKTRKILLKCSLACAIIMVVSSAGVGFYDLYLYSIRIVDNSNINTDEYLPFKADSKIARLDHEASLKFSSLDKLPIVDGAAALFPLYSSFVNATYPSNIMALNTENSPFQYHNTTGSIARLADGSVDLIFGVNPKASTYEHYFNGAKSNIEDIELVPMGREGFVFFTNKNNKIDSLSEDQLRGIYSGAITSWSEVGGSNTKILPFTRNVGSGSYQGLQKFMGDVPIIEGQTHLEYNLMSGIINAVADYENHPGAIGYSYYYYASALQANENIKILAVNDIAPSLETISSKTYPITSDFYMSYNKKTVTKETLKLVDWVLSSEGQELVYKSGYAKVN